MSNKNKNKIGTIPTIQPGPTSDVNAEPKKIVPELPIKNFKVYCEACSHTTNVGSKPIGDGEIVKCGNCGKDNKFESRNLLPV